MPSSSCTAGAVCLRRRCASRLCSFLVTHSPLSLPPAPSSSSSPQHCWLRAQMASQDATTFLTLMPHPLLLPQEKRTVAVRISNACSIDALWVRQVRRGGERRERLQLEMQ